MDPREKNLPKWAQEAMAQLRLRVEVATEQLTRELVKLRPQAIEWQRRFECMQELLTCAARGGHIQSQDIVAVIGSYSLKLESE